MSLQIPFIQSLTGYQIPEDCETKVIPGSLWAQFPCTVDTLQDVNSRIWSEWLPTLQGYKLANDCSIEVYLPKEDGSGVVQTSIWVSLEKI